MRPALCYCHGCGRIEPLILATVLGPCAGCGRQAWQDYPSPDRPAPPRCLRCERRAVVLERGGGQAQARCVACGFTLALPGPAADWSSTSDDDRDEAAA